jgi:hypothetical protein
MFGDDPKPEEVPPPAFAPTRADASRSLASQFGKRNSYRAYAARKSVSTGKPNQVRPSLVGGASAS